MRLHLDFETFSEVGIDVGTYAYATHPSTEALMLGYAADSSPVKVWDIKLSGQTMPDDLRMYLHMADELWAYNAEFERLIMQHKLGIIPGLNRWRCAQVLAYSMSFAGTLNEVLTEFDIPMQKDPEGRRLIHKFSKLQPVNRKKRRWQPMDDIVDWGRFMEYCRQDVAVERRLVQRCDRAGAYVNWDDYMMDQEINGVGLPFDMELVHQVLHSLEIERGRLLREMKGITGLENPNSVQQLRGWLESNSYPYDNLRKGTVQRALKEELTPAVEEVLELRLQLSKSSVAKWAALTQAVEEDDRLRGAFQFVGAGRTGRWSGRKFQPHNLPQPTTDGDVAAEVVLSGGYDLVSMVYDRPMDVFSSLLRSALSAPDGYKLVVADLMAIEGRLAGWMCKCPLMNQTYREGLDAYKVLASRIFGVPYDQVEKWMRKFSKPAALGSQYGLGARGLKAYAEDFGVEMSIEESQHTTDVFRMLYPEIPEAWGRLNEAVDSVMNFGGVEHACRCLWKRAGEFLQCILPSQRSIWYYKPALQLRKTPWGEMRLTLTYMGKDQYTQQWKRISTHGGKLLENIIQATARDVLREWIHMAKKARLAVIGHVHDEIILQDVHWEADATLDFVIDLIRDNRMPWGQDLLLDASGYTAKRYRKD